jgi:hypothetical protein
VAWSNIALGQRSTILPNAIVGVRLAYARYRRKHISDTKAGSKKAGSFDASGVFSMGVGGIDDERAKQNAVRAAWWI